MSVIRRIALGSAVGMLVCASAAVAQDRQRTRQPERTDQNLRDQDQTRPWDSRMRQGQSEFGQIRDMSSPLAQIADLSGMWEMQVTIYPEDGDDNARPARTLNGIAERRWILNGSVMMERYSMAGGGQASLPLQELGQTTFRTGSDQFNQQDPNRTNQPDARDRNNQRQQYPNDPNQDFRDRDRDRDQTRDPNRDIYRDANRDQITRDQDRRNINDPYRSRTTTQGQVMQPTQGIVLWGYDAGADEFTVVWSDDASSGLRCDTGTLGDDGRLTLKGKCYDPRTQETLDTRVVIDMISPEMQRVTMYTDAGLLSAERLHMEIVYRRAGQGAFATPDRTSDRPAQPERRVP